MKKVMLIPLGAVLCLAAASASVLTMNHRSRTRVPSKLLTSQPATPKTTQSQDPSATRADIRTAADAAPASQKIPDYVVYWHLFHHSNFLKQQASLAERKGADAGLTRDFYKRAANLNETQALVLDEIAAKCELDVNVVDAEAKVVIDRFRANHPTGQLKAGEALPPPPAELLVLQERRNNLVLEARDRLLQSFGPAEFDRFQKFVEEKVAPQIKPRSADTLRPAMDRDKLDQPLVDPYKNQK